MNIALIIAGGVGQRMGQSIPKQFISIYDKPIIVYTLEAFQKHPSIDKICVVCVEGWHDVLRAYAKQFGITKLDIICNGGSTGQESIYNGLKSLEGVANDKDIIVVHDAIRPMVSSDIISDCIQTAEKHGNAVAVIPCQEAMMVSKDDISANGSYPRHQLKRTQTPQAMKYGLFMKMHEKALSMGITSSVATCTMIIETGGVVYYSQGSEKNVKLTTPDDVDIFKALLRVREEGHK
ncbi:MAG: 2-C-methyl-D-erythritol 4-phosphate cytidylyltransferase [Bacilli bacterium]|nr:2-C-methyl-D-erythritol 4-phosphate cytidylyltransferase [Bacilli bacterium]